MADTKNDWTQITGKFVRQRPSNAVIIQVRVIIQNVYVYIVYCWHNMHSHRCTHDLHIPFNQHGKKSK